ncbi:MAG TPA: dual specificity protein phosphatase [Anaerolineae bacterium]|nr:dual specificity protein phosphatase [Anaerolineae bacterium]
MNPFHYIFDKMYPLIRFIHEKIRRNLWFEEIIPQLWLGGAPTYARDYQFLVDNKLNAVINIRAERVDDLEHYAQNDINHIQLKVYDTLPPPPHIIEEGVEFIKEQIDTGRTVLVHCAKGRSRSATLVAGYLMRYHNMSYDEAVALMKSKRKLTSLQSRHRRVLAKWQEEYSS